MHHRAKLKALADNLMSQFAALEAEQQVERMSRKDADGSAVTASQQGTNEGRSTSITAVTSTSTLGTQEAMEEVGLDTIYGREETAATHLSGESPVTLDAFA